MFKKLINAALLAAAAQSPAAADHEVQQVLVRYGDLDLTQPADIRVFERRLTRAIMAACPCADGVVEMSQLRGIALCQRQKRAEVAPLREQALALAARRSMRQPIVEQAESTVESRAPLM